MLKIEGIQCDNKSCDYEDMNVKMDDYKNWLNKPCPKCGENLLTEKDYKAVLALVKIMDNPIIKFIDKVAGKFGSKKKTFKAEMDGSGKIDLKEDKEKRD